MVTHVVSGVSSLPDETPLRGKWVIGIRTTSGVAFDSDHSWRGGHQAWDTAADGSLSITLPATDGNFLYDASFESRDKKVKLGPYPFDLTADKSWQDIIETPTIVPVTPASVTLAQAAATAASSAATAAATSAAAAAAVGTTNDTLIAGRINTPSSATVAALVARSRAQGYKVLTDYSGADPTGATDSTAAINAMVTDAATNGGRALIPPGTWLVSVASGAGGNQYMIEAKPGLTLASVDKSSTTIKVASGQPNFRSVVGHDSPNAIDGFILDGITFNMNATGNPVTSAGQVIGNNLQRAAFFTDTCARPTVRNCRFIDTDSTWVVSIKNATWGAVVDNNDFEWTTSPHVDHDASTIYCASQSGSFAGLMQITNNRMIGYAQASTFFGSRTAIETHGSRQLVTGNTIVDYYKAANVTGVASTSDDIIFSNNVLSGIRFGVELWSVYYSTGVTGYQLRNVKVTNNTMTMDPDKWGFFGQFVFKNATDNSGMQNVDISGNTFRMKTPTTYTVGASSSAMFAVYFPHTMRTNLWTTQVANTGAGGHAQITDANANFTSDDIGSWVLVQQAGTDMEPVAKTANALHAQIESVQSSTTATVNKAATTLFSSGAPTSAIVGYVKSTNVHIKNNTFDNWLGGGVRYLVPTVGLDISDNKFRNMGLGAPTQSAAFRAGIFLAAPLQAAKVDRNEFIDDQASATLGFGIENITTGIGTLKGTWTGPGTSFVAGDVTSIAGLAYMTSVAHSSAASFATDLAAGKWYPYPGSTSDCQALDNRVVIADAASVGTVKTFASELYRPFTIRHRVQQYIAPTTGHPFGYASEVIDHAGGKTYFQADAPRGSNWVTKLASINDVTPVMFQFARTGITINTTTSVFAGDGTASLSHVMLRPGRVVGLTIFSNSAMTAGSVTAFVRKNSAATNLTAGVQVNTTDTISKVLDIGYANGIAFAATDLLKVVFVADATAAPLTQNFRVAVHYVNDPA